MKLSAGTIGIHIAIFIWSIFMGVTAVSIGLGADYPPLNQVAKPFVCPNGKMSFNESTSNPLPGTTYTRIGWYCVDNREGHRKAAQHFPDRRGRRAHLRIGNRGADPDRRVSL